MKRPALILVATLAFGAAGAAPARAAPPTAAAPVDGEAVLMARLLAPCYYTQTLDVHESPEAATLRTEVRARLRAGESAAAIEQDFVVRYGERVRALPAGHDPRVALGLLSAGLVISAGALMARAVSRWRRAADAGTGSVGAAEDAASRDDYDARIDEELRELR